MFTNKTSGDSNLGDTRSGSQGENQAEIDTLFNDPMVKVIEAKLIEAAAEKLRKAAQTPDYSAETRERAFAIIAVTTAVKSGVFDEIYTIEALKYYSQHRSLEGYIPSKPNFSRE